MKTHRATRLLQPPAGVPEGFASLALPLHRASTVLFADAESFARRKSQRYDGYTYGLYGTPTSEALARKLAGIEGAARTVLAPSGLAAIALVNFSVLKAGDGVLLSDAMYGPTRDAALKLLEPLGVRPAFYDPRAGARIARALGKRVKLVWVESPGSITMEMQDVRGISEAAHRVGARVAVDNTWATPLFFRPLEHGADFSVQALTKFAGGHSDLLLGSVAVRDRALFRRLRDMQGLLGIGASADDCYLAMRGLATLAVRLERQCASALEIARWLQAQPPVAGVLHPGLESDAGHALWRRDCAGAGAVFSLRLRARSWRTARRFVDALRLFRIGASWGGVHSLVAAYPAPPARALAARSFQGPIVRLSIGLEHAEDLMDDLRNAMKGIR